MADHVEFDDEVARVNIGAGSAQHKRKHAPQQQPKPRTTSYSSAAVFKPPTLNELHGFDVGGFPGDGISSMGPGPLTGAQSPAAMRKKRAMGIATSTSTYSAALPRASTSLGFDDTSSVHSEASSITEATMGHIISPLVKNALRGTRTPADAVSSKDGRGRGGGGGGRGGHAVVGDGSALKGRKSTSARHLRPAAHSRAPISPAATIADSRLKARKGAPSTTDQPWPTYLLLGDTAVDSSNMPDIGDLSPDLDGEYEDRYILDEDGAIMEAVNMHTEAQAAAHASPHTDLRGMGISAGGGGGGGAGGRGRRGRRHGQDIARARSQQSIPMFSRQGNHSNEFGSGSGTGISIDKAMEAARSQAGMRLRTVVASGVSGPGRQPGEVANALKDMRPATVLGRVRKHDARTGVSPMPHQLQAQARARSQNARGRASAGRSGARTASAMYGKSAGIGMDVAGVGGHPGDGEDEVAGRDKLGGTGTGGGLGAGSGDDLLEENPVAYFVRMRESGVPFVHLNQWRDPKGLDSNPYRLIVVPRNNVESKYYTMSVNGVTFVDSDGSSEFIPMAQWIRETDTFNMLRSLDVFRLYRFWKAFEIWRRFVRRRRFKATREQLQQRMFTILPRFRECLFDVLKMSHDVLETRLLVLKLRSAYTTGEFADAQAAQRRAVKDVMNAYADEVSRRLELTCQEVCDPARTRVADNVGPGRKKLSLRQILLLERERAQERAQLTEQVNAEIRLIGRLVRVVNYIMLEHLVDLITEDFSDVAGTLRMDKASLFRAEVVFSERGAVDFVPNCRDTASLVSESLSSIVDLLDSLPLVLHHPPFRKFLWLAGMDARTLQLQGPRLTPFVREVARYGEILDETSDLIEHSYAEAVDHSTVFDQFRVIHHFNQQWTPAVYRAQRERERDAYLDQAVEDWKARIIEEEEELGPASEVTSSQIIKLIADEKRDAQRHREPGFPTHSSMDPELYSGDLAAFALDLRRFQRWTADLERMQVVATRGVLLIDAKALKNILVPVPERATRDVKGLLAAISAERTAKLTDDLRGHMKVLTREPSGLEEFCSLAAHLQSMPSIVIRNEEERYHIDTSYELLAAAKVNLSFNDQQAHSLLHATSIRFNEALAQAEVRVHKLSPSYQKNLERTMNGLVKQLEAVRDRLSGVEFNPESIDAAAPQRLLAELSEIRSSLTEPVARLEKYKGFQAVFDQEYAAGSLVESVFASMEHYEAVWKLAGGWRMLVETYGTMAYHTLGEPFAAKVRRVAEEVKQVAEKNPDSGVAKQLLAQVTVYLKALPGLSELSVAHMQPRHWSRLLITIRAPHEDEDLSQITLPQLIRLGVFKHLSIVTDVANSAAGEFELESSLYRARQRWQELELDVRILHARRPDILILVNADALREVLEDSEIQLANMLVSKHIGGIHQEALLAREQLNQMLVALTEWEEGQKRWQWLDAVFAEEATALRFSTAAAKFRSVARQWAELARRARKDPNAMSTLLASGTLPTLREFRSTVDRIQRGLVSWVDDRRVQWPRLFFLSDEEVFNLNSRLLDVQAVEPHLPSLFGAVKSLIFKGLPEGERAAREGAAPEVVGVRSAEGEEVHFIDETVVAEGAVDSWLQKVDMAIKHTLPAMLKEAVLSAAELIEGSMPSLTSWLKKHPSQILLAAWHVVWTRRVEDCFGMDNELKSLGRLSVVYEQHVVTLTHILASMDSTTTRVARAKAESLLTLCRYELDVIQSMVTRPGAGDVGPVMPEWQLCWRMVWSSETRSLTSHIGPSSLQYGFDYVGPIVPVPILPDSHSARLGVALAVSRAAGVMVTGVPGSKSVLVRDLAALHGRCLVTLQGGAVVRPKVLRNIVAGAAGCGAWLLVEDIDRMDTSASTILGHHVSVALEAMQTGQPAFQVEWPSGSDLPIIKGCAFLATMRQLQREVTDPEPTVIPTVLREVFRPVALSRPAAVDVAVRCLEVGGFSAADALGHTLGEFLSSLQNEVSRSTRAVLAAEGLRPLASIVRAAVSSRRAESDIEEATMIARAVVAETLGLMQTEMDREVHRDVFHRVLGEDSEHLALHSVWSDRMLRLAIDQELAYMKLSGTEEFCAQLNQMYLSLAEHRSIVVSGDPGAGKTTCIEALASALGRIAVKKIPEGQNAIDVRLPQLWGPVRTTRIHWGALTDSHLLGYYKNATGKDAGATGADKSNNANANVNINPNVSANVNVNAAGAGADGDGEGEIVRGWQPGLIADVLRGIVDSGLAGSSDSNAIGVEADADREQRRERDRTPPKDDGNTRGDHYNRMHWVVLDGPMEAGRLDSLGALLDDSAELLEQDGTRLRLPLRSRVIVETTGLEDVSPALLARLAVIHIPSKIVEPQHIVESWLQKSQYVSEEPLKSTLGALLHDHIGPAVDFVCEMMLDGTVPLAPTPTAMTQCVCNLIHGVIVHAEAGSVQLAEAAGDDYIADTSEEEILNAERAFVFGLTWGLGGIIGNEGGRRVRFSDFLMDRLHDLECINMCAAVEKGATLFDLVVSHGGFSTWDDIVAPDMNPRVLVDPRDVDTLWAAASPQFAQIGHVSNLLMNSGAGVVVLGPGGVGKTAAAHAILSSLDTDKYTTAVVPCSPFTAPDQIKKELESGIEFERRAVLAAPNGMCAAFCVTDMHRTVPEDRVIRRPVAELLRQLCDVGGYFDSRRRHFTTVRRLKLVVTADLEAAWQSNGREGIRAFYRFLRHLYPFRVSVPTTDDAEAALKSVIGSRTELPLPDLGAKRSALLSSLAEAASEITRRMHDGAESKVPITIQHALRSLHAVLGVLPNALPDNEKHFAEGATVLAKLWMCQLRQHVLGWAWGEAAVAKTNKLVTEVVSKHPTLRLAAPGLIDGSVLSEAMPMIFLTLFKPVRRSEGGKNGGDGKGKGDDRAPPSSPSTAPLSARADHGHGHGHGSGSGSGSGSGFQLGAGADGPMHSTSGVVQEAVVNLFSASDDIISNVDELGLSLERIAKRKNEQIDAPFTFLSIWDSKSVERAALLMGVLGRPGGHAFIAASGSGSGSGSGSSSNSDSANVEASLLVSVAEWIARGMAHVTADMYDAEMIEVNGYNTDYRELCSLLSKACFTSAVERRLVIFSVQAASTLAERCPRGAALIDVFLRHLPPPDFLWDAEQRISTEDAGLDADAVARHIRRDLHLVLNAFPDERDVSSVLSSFSSAGAQCTPVVFNLETSSADREYLRGILSDLIRTQLSPELVKTVAAAAAATAEPAEAKAKAKADARDDGGEDEYADAEDLVQERARDRLVDVCMDILMAVAMEHHRIGSSNCIPPTVCQSFAEHLVDMWTSKNRESKSHLESHRQAVSTIRGLMKQVSQWEGIVKDLKPRVKGMTDDSQAQLETLQRKRDLTNRRRTALDVQKSTLMERREDVERLHIDAQHVLDRAETALIEAMAGVSGLTNDDIGEIISAFDPRMAGGLVGAVRIAEALCVILGQDEASLARFVSVAEEESVVGTLDEFTNESLSCAGNFFDMHHHIKSEFLDEVPDSNEMPTDGMKVLRSWLVAWVEHSAASENAENQTREVLSLSLEFEDMERDLETKEKGVLAAEKEVEQITGTYETLAVARRESQKKLDGAMASLRRTDKLVNAVAGEVEHWQNVVDDAENEMSCVVGDSFLAATCVELLGPFNPKSRATLLNKVIATLKKADIQVSESFSVASFLVPDAPALTLNWVASGLLNDDDGTSTSFLTQDTASVSNRNFTVEQAAASLFCRRWPLFVDPEGHAASWIQSREASGGLSVVNVSDPNLIRVLSLSLAQGHPVLMTVDNECDLLRSSLRPIWNLRGTGSLVKPADPSSTEHTPGERRRIRIGGRMVRIHPGFRLYVVLSKASTDLSLSPSVHEHYAVHDFSVTDACLVNAFLDDLSMVNQLRMRRRRVIQSALTDYGEVVIASDELAAAVCKSWNADEDFISDVFNVDAVEALKFRLVGSRSRIEKARTSLAEMTVARNRWRATAEYAAVVYRAVADMSIIDDLYYVSLPQFRALCIETFFSSVSLSSEPDDPEHVKSISQALISAVHSSLWHGIRMRDRAGFAFLLSVRLQLLEGQVSPTEWAAALRGGVLCPSLWPNRQSEVADQFLHEIGGTDVAPDGGAAAADEVEADADADANAEAQAQAATQAQAREGNADKAPRAMAMDAMTLHAPPPSAVIVLPKWPSKDVKQGLGLLEAAGALPKGFVQSLESTSTSADRVIAWHAFSVSQSAHKELLPDNLDSHITMFQRLLIIATVCPGLASLAVSEYVRIVLGGQFVDTAPADLSPLVPFVPLPLGGGVGVGGGTTGAGGDVPTVTPPPPIIVVPTDGGADPMASVSKAAASFERERAAAPREGWLDPWEQQRRPREFVVVLAPEGGADVNAGGVEVLKKALQAAMTLGKWLVIRYTSSLPPDCVDALARSVAAWNRSEDGSGELVAAGAAEPLSPARAWKSKGDTAKSTSPHGATPSPMNLVTADTAHPGFRLFLVVDGAAAGGQGGVRLPKSLLNVSHKWVACASRGIRANLETFYSEAVEPQLAALSQTRKEGQLWKFIFAAAFFHSVVRERSQYPRLGFRTHPTLLASDSLVVVATLRSLVEMRGLPHDAIRQVLGNVIYGSAFGGDSAAGPGGWDRAVLETLLAPLMSSRLMDDSFTITRGGAYRLPPFGSTYYEHIAHIRSLAQRDPPDVIGLHDNATRVYALEQLRAMAEVALLAEFKQRGPSALPVAVCALMEDESKDKDEQTAVEVAEIASDLLGQMPAPPTLHGNASVWVGALANTVRQEHAALTETIELAMGALSAIVCTGADAGSGSLPQSEVAQAEYQRVKLGRGARAQLQSVLVSGLVPRDWAPACAAKTRHIGAWIEWIRDRAVLIGDLAARVRSVHDTRVGDRSVGIAPLIRLALLADPRAFLSAFLEDWARRSGVAPVQASYSFDFVRDSQSQSVPVEACVLTGISIEGATLAIEDDTTFLREMVAGQIRTTLPPLVCLPVIEGEIDNEIEEEGGNADGGVGPEKEAGTIKDEDGSEGSAKPEPHSPAPTAPRSRARLSPNPRASAHARAGAESGSYPLYRASAPCVAPAPSASASPSQSPLSLAVVSKFDADDATDRQSTWRWLSAPVLHVKLSSREPLAHWVRRGVKLFFSE